MSFDPEQDHQRYCELMRGYVERLREHFPRAARMDTAVLCFDSLAVFEETYPGPEQRDNLLERFQEIQDSIEACRPLFDLFDVESDEGER